MSDFPDTMSIVFPIKRKLVSPAELPPTESPPAEPSPTEPATVPSSVGPPHKWSDFIEFTRLNESDYESEYEYDDESDYEIDYEAEYEAVIEEPSEEVSNSVNCCKYDHASIVGKMESLAQNGHITEQEYIDWAMLVKEHWESRK
jgi:hypothetical protein